MSSPAASNDFTDLVEPADKNAAPSETPEEHVLDRDWPHQRLEFLGDNLAVRIPTQQALAGFSLASSKYVPNQVKNDMTGLFLTEHIGPESYGRVMQRLMDGDDPDYTTESIGAMMREIVLLGVKEPVEEPDDQPDVAE
jgi:hypothetical protein